VVSANVFSCCATAERERVVHKKIIKQRIIVFD